MAGKTIKQLTSRVNPALTDYLYLVAGENDYNVTLQKLADLLGVEGTEGWRTITIDAGTTHYLPVEDATKIGAVVIEYFIRRDGRSYHAGVVTIRNDGTNVDYEDYWPTIDSDDNGITFDAQLASGFLQLNISADSSDPNSVAFNYRITVRKPLVVLTN
jgi:hypothetical protein